MVNTPSKESEVTVIYVSSLLGVPSAELSEHIVVKEGDRVEKGQLLARTPKISGAAALWGSEAEEAVEQMSEGHPLREMLMRRVRSSVSSTVRGTISLISLKTGAVYISHASSEAE